MLYDRRLSVSTAALTGWPIGLALKTIAGGGIADVEVVITSQEGGVGYDDCATAQLRAMLAQHDLELVGLAASTDLPAGHPDLPSVLASAEALGAKYLRIFPPAFIVGTRLDDQLEQLRITVARLCDYRANPSTELLLEVAQDTLVPSPELAWRALAPVARPALGVLYDPANMLVEGHLRPDLSIACLDHLLRHVHVKNQVVTRRAGQVRRHFASLGEGGVDWTGTLQSLIQSGYRGGFTIDHLAGPPSAAQIRQDVSAFGKVLALATRAGNACSTS